MLNFKSRAGGTNASLTEAMTRCAVGTMLAPVDRPPAERPLKPIDIDYPHINSQPEYAAEFEKLSRFTAQLEKATKDLAALRVEFSLSAMHEEQTEEGAISKAETLLAGDKPRDLRAEMRAAAKLIDALNEAIAAQNAVLLRVNRTLSHAAGRRYSEEHKERVKRVMAAVDELYAANQAETSLRTDLARLGYSEATVPAMPLLSVQDPTAICESITYYWYEEAKNYVKTDAELAAGVRKARLAAAVG